MKTLLILFILLFSLPYASSSELESKIKPLGLKSLDLNHEFSKKAAHLVLGNAALVEGKIEYYEKDGVKYPLSLEYKGDKVKKIYALYLDQKIYLQDLKGLLKDFSKKEIKGQEAELFYYLESKDKKLLLKIKLTDNSLYSIEKWF